MSAFDTPTVSDAERAELGSSLASSLELVRLGLITTLKRRHTARDRLRLITCNSGRRSRYAASLLRSLACPKALSVGGACRACKKLQAAA
jgi:hypothetical protein